MTDTMENATSSEWVPQTPEETRRFNQRLIMMLLGAWLLIFLAYVAISGSDSTPSDLTGRLLAQGDEMFHEVDLPAGAWFVTLTEFDGDWDPYVTAIVPDETGDQIRCQGRTDNVAGRDISASLPPDSSFWVVAINGGHRVRVGVHADDPGNYKIEFFEIDTSTYSNAAC